MMSPTRTFSRALLTALVTLAVPIARAQEIAVERLDVNVAQQPALVANRISGDEIIDYLISAEASQILSVDLRASNASAYFNVLPAGSETALFVGSTSGNVADVHLPEDGDYAIRVYLMRNAARRGESADYELAVGIGAPEFADGLSGGPDYWEVAGVGGGDALNVRGGPSTRYAVIGIVRNADVLQNRGCRMSGDQRWCSVRAVGSGVTGWVAGRYLRETAPPRSPDMPPGGPVGNGGQFDATGAVPCRTTAGAALQQCLFGVVRQGSGNAGVWLAIGSGAERYFLFEAGEVTYSDSGAQYSVEMQGDLYIIETAGERYEIPEAVVNGG